MRKSAATPHALKMAKGRKLRQQKAFLDAAAAYDDASKMLPRSRAGLFVALCLRDAERFDQAEAAFRAYLEVNAEDFEGWTSYGTFLKNTGRLEDSIAPLRTALTIRDDAEVRNALIGVLWRAGQVQEAKQEGHHNIRLKDRNALAGFKASVHRKQRLRDGGGTFDPSQRTRNIIAFSLWGDRPEYITGAIVNAQIAQHIYVCWTPRFYCDNSVPADAIHALRAYGAQVVLMDRPEHQRYRPMWRFLVSDDPDVNVFICRDADSRLNAKELLAVNAWLESGKRFHIMRDHIYHHELILAGMWGGTAGVLPNIAGLLGDDTRYFDNKFGDQAFLADFVWPLIREDVLIHDTHFRYPKARKFPTGYDLPGSIHVGGGVKTMPHWSQYVQLPGQPVKRRTGSVG
ncbi:hypothetical protein [uncultured Pseudosulfitobacter sp.]|jgi:tetratricopeptide (TPR) repeat protein|uniref:hypothetical protein n=1 Tax=uncultured Pseudosulfitobacter sp. TaxID=2854214 RepID=UPI0030DC2437|tara:strand:+ start:2619 stop:3821 length:1203 start_codon:yes stop_codon:yes gene_type:complete